MAEVAANSKVSVCAKRMLPRGLRAVAAGVLAVGVIFPVARIAAQNGTQNGPPTTGDSASILFVPATLSPVSGFNPANGHLNTGGYGGDGMLANSSTSQFSYPVGMAYDTHGNLFIADGTNHVVRRIDAVTGDLSTFAGQQANYGFYPNSGTAPATSAELGYDLAGLVVDSSNNVYVSDRSNNVVWKITSGGTISIFAGAGAGSCGSGIASDGLGDGCPAGDATLNNPWALGIDANNNIYIADSYNNLVRVISSSTGKITIFAGDVNDAGSFGDCNANPYSVAGPGPYLATQAHLGFPEGIAFDSSGNAYISSATCDTVQVVDSNGYISIFAGTYAVRSSTGNGGPATAATLDEPAGIYVDSANRVYISDFFGGEVRMVDSTGNINDVMGSSSGELNNSSIGKPDTEPILNSSTGQFSGAADGIYSILMDPYGNILASDSSGDAITSAGTTGQYYFGNNNQIYQTVTTTSLNVPPYYFYPPYITISNPSNVTLNFSGTPTVTTLTPSATPAAFALDGGTCNFSGSLPPGASCTVVVSFTPTEGGTGTGTAYTGTIVIDSNSNSSPNTILLSGNGIGTCQNSASLTSFSSFSSPPNVASLTQTTTITNNGNCPYSTSGFAPAIVFPSPATPTAFSVVSDNCPATLNINASCTVGVDFTPSALSSYSADLQVSIPNYGNLRTNLSGTGIIAPAVSFNPTTLTFPTTLNNVTTSSMSTVMTNIGNATLNNIVVSIAGDNPTYFAFNGTNNCGSTLAAGAFCTISVDFTPQATLTNFSAAIAVADNAAGTPQTIALTGIGTATPPPANLSITETLHFSDAPVLNSSTLLSIAEMLHFSDAATTLTPSTLLNIAEALHFTDTASAQEPVAMVMDNEVIHTTDTPVLAQSKLVLDTETIHTSDLPALTESKLVLDAETIHTADTPALTLTKLILDAETIHTTDTPTETTLTSPTTTTLVSTTATPSAGNPVTFTATVSSTAGTPTGNVTFYDGATSLSTVALVGGTATYSTSSLSVGAHSITTVYAGNAAFLTSTSNTLPELVTDFTISFTNPTGAGITLTILPGMSGTYTITLTPPAGGYSGTITLSVSGLPPGATASFSPNPVTLGSTAVTSTLTITIPAAMVLSNPASPWPGQGRNILLLGLLLPLIGMRRKFRRSLRGFIAMALLAVCIWGITSCGGNFFTQPPQSYVVTVTATSGTNQQSGTIDLNVP